MNKPEICRGCPAYNAPGPVWSDHGDSIEIILVLEAPGENEIHTGKGVTGSSGGLMWHLGAQAGIHRHKAFVTNVAHCLTKNPGAFSYCWEHITKPELDKLDPSIPIIAFGNEAKHALVPELDRIKITAARGTRVGRVTCTLHPAYLRRTAGQSRQPAGDKQDLAPAVIYDMGNALKNRPIPTREYDTMVFNRWKK